MEVMIPLNDERSHGEPRMTAHGRDGFPALAGTTGLATVS